MGREIGKELSLGGWLMIIRTLTLYYIYLGTSHRPHLTCSPEPQHHHQYCREVRAEVSKEDQQIVLSDLVPMCGWNTVFINPPSLPLTTIIPASLPPTTIIPVSLPPTTIIPASLPLPSSLSPYLPLTTIIPACLPAFHSGSQ
ncbi:hypothetical protein Pcinc_019874 [Petrolisthes cinctipes]|uniref:Uncharacterized protein n=1 Tax=Petrolisthes cinctipes TaxID=88211 RepID=A0AAE1FJ96_PETCI|nr:hypothetical protein Pcinc_019874 [Petrolisthes cinctipes]